MAGEVSAATAAASPTPELAWSPSTMTDADIEALVAQGLLLEKAISRWRSCFGEAFPSEDWTETVVFRSFYEKGFGLPSGAFFWGLLHYYGLEAMHLKPNSIAQIAIFIHLCEGFLGIVPIFNLWRAMYHLRAYPSKGGKYRKAIFKDNNKRWAEEWFVVVNPALGLPLRTGLALVLNARWEEKPTEEEMVEVEVLLAELQKLKAEKLTGAAVTLSFPKRLTQPIQERVHPGYEYSGREDLTHGQNRKVSRSEAHKRVTLIMSGEVRDKGCPKAYFLKWPTTDEKLSFWCPAPLLEGQQGKDVDLPIGLALPSADVGSYSSDSSIGSESDDVVVVSGPAASAGTTTKKRRPTCKVATSKAQQGGVASRGRSSTPPATSRVEAEAAAEKAGLTTPKPEEEDQEEPGR
ncbi:putative gypsy-type retrotransposon [Panicum miliaceum]|uniref:Gypsy-type retrotransposon n=1 Tax=Panicum miliaceum TaxID=4540 RepID=A0A3L6RXC7_PANMI|nr:putative gypsy-type retrotransposon [Panicum miliaceum]